MPLGDLTTYEVWLNDDGDTNDPILLFTFQDEVGLDDATVQTNAIARLQDIIDKLTTPTPDTVLIRVGVIHPPAISVRRQKWQDKGTE